MSIRLRLTITLVAVVAVGLIALALALALVVERAVRDQHDHALAGRARALAALVEYDDGRYEFELAGALAAGLGTSGQGTYYQVWGPDGDVLARSDSLAAAALPRAHGTLERPRYLGVQLPDGRDGRLVGVAFIAHDDSDGDDDAAPPGEVTLVLAEDVADVEATLATVRRWSWGGGLGTLLLVGLVTAWTVRRGVRPLSRLAEAIEAIDPARLSARLPREDRPAELEVVARKLDELLARLDASFARERRFTADVSHELRTPLAGLRTLLEVTARRERSTDDYRAAVAEAEAIVGQLGALVDNLLTLARLDAGLPVASAPVAVRELVEECWRPHRAAAERRRLRFDNRLVTDTIVTTDREKLRLVIGNLLGNAVEYTEEGGWIAVAGGDDVVVEVLDSGPPIPAADLERIFDRMWRADAARSAGVHAGIGLSLARTLCLALGYTITAATLDDGAVRFRVAAP